MSDEEEALGMWWWEQELEEEEEREDKKRKQGVQRQLTRRQPRPARVNIIKFGLQHPKLYIKLYAGFCLVWEILCGIVAFIILVTVPGALLIFVPFFSARANIKNADERKRIVEKVRKDIIESL